MNLRVAVLVGVAVAVPGCAGRELEARGDGGLESGPESFVAAREVCVMVPVDDEAWDEAVNRELYESGPAAELKVAFVQRLLPRRHGASDERVAAEWVLTRYAPSFWRIELLERHGSTVVVALNVDGDGYAGVSQTRRRVQPVLERTLLCQPGVKKVVDPPPPPRR